MDNDLVPFLFSEGIRPAGLGSRPLESLERVFVDQIIDLAGVSHHRPETGIDNVSCAL